MSTYEEFVAKKLLTTPTVGLSKIPKLSDHLFSFQKDIVKWALRRGRAAIFADCGMGKSAMQLEWAHHVARHTNGKVLILAPLAVATQTVREGEKFGIPAKYARTGADVGDGITVANYEMLHAFDPEVFAGVVLDESSILKAYDGKTRTMIIDAFKRTPYRLACTATPAPNDHVELGNHSEFLGIMSRTEMLATFFCHDGGETQTWRLKGHAEQEFWKWVCSWGVMARKPSDLGHSDEGFILPPLEMKQHVVEVDQAGARAAGMLFAMEARSLQEQRGARKGSLETGFGMNWQHCANVAFVGVSHSYEQTYQAIRRCWRFGQKYPVTVHVINAETEGAVAANLARKERDAKKMADAMVAHMMEFQSNSIKGSARESLPYNPQHAINVPDWCNTHTREF